MRLALVVNPYASSVNAKRRARVEEALAAGHDLTVVETDCRDHATTLAAEAAAARAEVVVVLGGDGTLNEAANGLIGTGAALAPLPGGSTNVFARTIGVPNDLGKAVVQLGRSLDAGSIRRMPLGVVNGRRFLFHVGLGFDAAVVEQVERHPALKHKLGQTAFVYATLATLARHFDLRRSHFTMHYGESTVDGAYAVVMNSNPYTFLGRISLNLTSDAQPGRGLVAVTVRTMHLPAVLGLLTSAIGTGKRLRRNPGVDHRADLRAFTVSGPSPFPYQADGDFLGMAEELTFSYEPDALAIVASPPKG
ncbi:MAG TPA: diacylglycerol kinase family protein [Acidimicrobiales bacterium]|nr:diacylglycerol kinase family protein [Acidimicrobiales bacterium]